MGLVRGLIVREIIVLGGNCLGGNYPATEILFLSSIKTTLPNIVGVCECLNLIA